jgi:hypothetical protein
MAASLLTIPAELVHYIRDNLHQVTILLSLRNVCTRLDAIIDDYPRFQVCLMIIQIFNHSL